MTLMEAMGKALATIEGSDSDDPNGGFTAVLSTPSLDRDGDRLNRQEWQEPLPDRLPLDIDHGMTVADTIGSFHPYFDEQGRLLMDAVFASTPKAQEVRTLIKEGHVNSVSVAFMTDRNKKAGEPRRELLNAGVVAIPSNRDALITHTRSARAAELVKAGVMTPEEAKEALGLPSEAKDGVSREGGDAPDTKAPRPYGDVHYADPEDGKYPIDTVAHIRAALAYINVQKNYDALGDHAAHVKRAIEAAARSHGIKVADDGKAVGDADTKAPQGQSAGSGDRAMLQAIHDASVHMGALCVIPLASHMDNTGEASGANTSGTSKDNKAESLNKALLFDADDDPRKLAAGIDAVLDQAIKLSADADRSTLPEPVAQALDLLVGVEESVDKLLDLMGVYDPDDEDSDNPKSLREQFKAALTEVLESHKKSPVDSPAEAAAASVEEPVPAVDAADDAADPDVAAEKRARDMRFTLLTSQFKI